LPAPTGRDRSGRRGRSQGSFERIRGDQHHQGPLRASPRHHVQGCLRLQAGYLEKGKGSRAGSWPGAGAVVWPSGSSAAKRHPPTTYRPVFSSRCSRAKR
jgi:hypothetical protein